jgi:hypothetical protein
MLRRVGRKMSKEDFVRLFETPATTVSTAQANFLERTTIATLACGSVISIIGVVVTLIGGNLV